MSTLSQAQILASRPVDRARLARARADFLAACPEFVDTRALDELRARDFARLDEQGQVYLDYTGSGLYAETQVRRHAELLLQGVFGNPHSSNPASAHSTRLVERCRERVLRFFRADPAEYALAFTANASHALKLVGEAYPFEPGGRLLLTFDNHNSVNGIREFSRAHGAATVYVPLAPPELRVDEQALLAALAEADPRRRNLFAFPAQSNFSGVQHPLEWIETARARGWDVLLDAAAFAPTNRLDLSRFRPDFVVLSFYKMFGYPTGVGALLARHEALTRLRRPWFSGGTIEVASVSGDAFVPARGAARFEDGTPDFANIPAVEYGLELLESVGIERVHARIELLCGYLLRELLALRHANGRALARVYGPQTPARRGGTLAFNLYDPQGRAFDHVAVERGAAELGISLRSGSFCNPGAGELALGLLDGGLESCASGAARTAEDQGLAAQEAGAVRASLGIVSDFGDVWAFLEYARTFLR